MTLELHQTCVCSPEQYDVYYKSEKIGYLRLRHGRFRAEYKGKLVYSSDTYGDGMFTDEERHGHLQAASKAILEAIPLYDIVIKLELPE